MWLLQFIKQGLNLKTKFICKKCKKEQENLYAKQIDKKDLAFICKECYIKRYKEDPELWELRLKEN